VISFVVKKKKKDETGKKYCRFVERLSLTRAISNRCKPSYARNMLSEQSRKWVDRAKDLWCKSFHNKPMWPINGRYQCASCLRYHAVRWEQVAGQHGAGREHTRQNGHRSLNSALIPAPRSAVVRLNEWKELNVAAPVLGKQLRPHLAPRRP